MTHPLPRERRAFTLIELLVVIGIIAILMTIGFGIAKGVRGNAKQRLTNTALISLDAMLDEYINEVGSVPEFPIADERVTEADLERFYRYPESMLNDPNDPQHIFSVAAFLRQARGISSVDALLGSLPEELVVRRGTIDAYGEDPDFLQDPGDEANAVTVVDGWDNEIFYIHPSVWDRSGSRLTNETNTALRFGMGLSSRPFFMSAGPDGRAGSRSSAEGQKWLEDNLYSSAPAGEHSGSGHDQYEG